MCNYSEPPPPPDPDWQTPDPINTFELLFYGGMMFVVLPSMLVISIYRVIFNV